VISGGGLAGLAWGGEYLFGLTEAGINVGSADLVVGTSAGSILGAQVQSDTLKRFASQFRLAAKTRLFERIRNDDNPHPTAERASDMFEFADNADHQTLISIGHAALTAKAPPQLALKAQVAAFVRRRKWPAGVLQTTTEFCRPQPMTPLC